MNKAIPAPLIAIVLLTAITIVTDMKVTRIGDMGDIAGTLPSFLLPNIALGMETFKIIFPVSLSLAVVGLVESMLTAQLVDELTDTKSNKNRECIGQGLANVVAGFFGGMAVLPLTGIPLIEWQRFQRQTRRLC